MAINRHIREKARKKTPGRCWYCGIPLFCATRAEYDHQTPKSRGGSDEIENIVLVCQECNGSKGDMTVEEFRDKLRAEIWIRKAPYRIWRRLAPGVIESIPIVFYGERCGKT